LSNGVQSTCRKSLFSCFFLDKTRRGRGLFFRVVYFFLVFTQKMRMGKKSGRQPPHQGPASDMPHVPLPAIIQIYPRLCMLSTFVLFESLVSLNLSNIVPFLMILNASSSTFVVVYQIINHINNPNSPCLTMRWRRGADTSLGLFPA